MNESAGAVESLPVELLVSAVAVGAPSSFSMQLSEAVKHGAGVEHLQMSAVLAYPSRDEAKL